MGPLEAGTVGGINVNWQVDVGQIIQIVVIVVAVVGAHFSLKSALAVFGTRLDAIERRLGETIDTFSRRLDRHEGAITSVTGELQRVIGSLERRKG